MALPDPQVIQPAELPSATTERAASRRGLGLLTGTAAITALVFSIMLAGTSSGARASPDLRNHARRHARFRSRGNCRREHALC